MRKLATIGRCIAALLLMTSVARPAAGQAGSPEINEKLGPLAARHAMVGIGRSRAILRIVETESPTSIRSMVEGLGGSVRRTIPLINAVVVEVPSAALTNLAADQRVTHVSFDRRIFRAMERTGATVGAMEVRQQLGFDGSGIGVAIIDSGVTSWHDDLSIAGVGQRVHQFVDLVNGHETAYDDYGHGTHVAGIVAGNGFDSEGARSGIAPASHLVVLKVLDSAGNGRISDVIAALDYAVAHKDTYNIRVVNLSVAAGVYESYDTDPLTVAARRAVEAGLIVVAVAGNFGRYPDGTDAYGTITAPGNAPWVLTVGASNHSGTAGRSDDRMGQFSSRGPTAVDYRAKPDLVAPGVGIESLSAPNSSLYTTASAYLLNGTLPTTYLPYLSLSGTSMAAPVVSGTVALMLHANPTLTPNQVKAILQYTAHVYPAYDPLTEGAGFLNAEGAVQLAAAFAQQAPYVPSSKWSTRLIWGNQLFSGGRLTNAANAWSSDVVWGAATTSGGQSIEWGVQCSTSCDDPGAWAPWSNVSTSQNVVWGTTCGGADCEGPWFINSAPGVLWGSSPVWGTTDDDSVVWGTMDDDSVVWGTTDDDSVVWGTSCTDPSCEPVLWSIP